MVCANCRSPSHRTGSSERAYCESAECRFHVCAKSAKQQDDRIRHGRKPDESRTSHRPDLSFACPQHQAHPLPRHAGTEGPQSQISCPLMRSAMRRRNRPRRERISPMRCMSPYSTVRCVHDTRSTARRCAATSVDPLATPRRPREVALEDFGRLWRPTRFLRSLGRSGALPIVLQVPQCHRAGTLPVVPCRAGCGYQCNCQGRQRSSQYRAARFALAQLGAGTFSKTPPACAG
jgi:hypothetical protein